jgi:hypothetical protein
MAIRNELMDRIAVLNSQIKENVTLLTTVVRGVGRENAIKRWIEFHSQFGIPLVVVGDLSEEDVVSSSCVRLISTDNSLSLDEKMWLGLKNVHTPYVAWVADDDFILGMMLEEATATLLCDKEVVACDGMNIFVEERTGKRVNQAYSVKQFIALRRAKGGGMRERLIAYAENFAPMALHGLLRKEVLEEAVSMGSKVPARWGDNVCMAVVLSKGRIAMMSGISNIRSHGTRIIVHAKALHFDSDIPKEALILDRSLKEKLLSLFFAETTPKLYAAVEYYLLRSSGAFSGSQAQGGIAASLQQLWLGFCGWFLYMRWYLTNKRFRSEMRKIRSLVRDYPIGLN